jgi:cholesterol oxidase
VDTAVRLGGAARPLHYIVTGERFDAVVVGSGFGGSIAAYRMADAGHSVCLLERGRPWPAGSFPRSPSEITHRLYWDPSGGKFGIFDIWSFRKLEALVSSGLGGGSLIYANVLEPMPEDWFVDERGRPWPVTRPDLEPHYDEVARLLALESYPMTAEPYASVPKVRAFHDAAAANGWPVTLPKLAVTFRPAPDAQPETGVDFDRGDGNRLGALRQTCVLCGECDIGCNSGAKNTLDYTVLSARPVLERVDVRTLCEVRAFAPDRERGRGYVIRYVHHDLDRDDRVPHDTRALEVHEVRADRLVLAAGSVGTSWLLLRNRAAFPDLGPALGTRFCGNGDMLGFVSQASRPGPGGRPEPRNLDPSYGPVITSYVRRPGQDGRGFYLEDAGYPEFLNWAWQVQPAPALIGRIARFAYRRTMSRLTGRAQTQITGEVGMLLGEQYSARMMPLLAMGREVPNGRFYLDRGVLQLSWNMRESIPYFESVRHAMKEVAAALGGRLRDNPMWWFRRSITTHPVGGCPMGDSIDSGVVDENLEAWQYPGLFIADGSAMPGPVGANPSFTIAAVVHRAADRMVAPVGAR